MVKLFSYFKCFCVNVSVKVSVRFQLSEENCKKLSNLHKTFTPLALNDYTHSCFQIKPILGILNPNDTHTRNKAAARLRSLTVTWHLKGRSEEWTCLTWQLRWSGLQNNNKNNNRTERNWNVREGK